MRPQGARIAALMSIRFAQVPTTDAPPIASHFDPTLVW